MTAKLKKNVERDFLLKKKLILQKNNSFLQTSSPDVSEILILKQKLKEAEERERILQLKLKGKFKKSNCTMFHKCLKLYQLCNRIKKP